MVLCIFIERGVALLHFKTAASCAMLFRDVTAMLMKPTMGHLLRKLAKLKLPLPLVGSVRL